MFKFVLRVLALFLVISSAAHAGDRRAKSMAFLIGLMESTSGTCEPIEEIRDLYGMADLLSGELGKNLGMHSTNGAVSELFEENPRMAAAVWAGGFLGLAGTESGCLVVKLFLTAEADVAHRVISQLTQQ